MCPHLAAAAVDEHRGLAEPGRVLGDHHGLDRIDNRLHSLSLRAGRKRIGGAPERGDQGVRGCDRAVECEIEVADLVQRAAVGGHEDAIGVEVDHETADVGVLAVGADDRHGITGARRGEERVPTGGACARLQGVVGVGEDRVGPAGDDDVDPGQQRSERLLQADLLEMAHEHDLVHTGGDELVDPRLENRCERGHVVRVRSDDRCAGR